MKKIPAFVLVMVFLFGLSGCGSGGQQSIDYNSYSQKFVDALFSGNVIDAKAMSGADYADDMSEDINQFATVWAKYKFQEVKISSIRGWGPANVEVDKRVEVVYQYADKDKDNWAIGTLYVRIKSDGNTWIIADLQMIIPTN
jgi:hypothetical protein